TGLARKDGPALERALRAVSGVASATVNAGERRARVSYDPARLSARGLVAGVRQAGFDVGGATERLKVDGLFCSACVFRIEEALRRTPGVLSATLNPATNELTVSYLAGAVDRAGVARAVEEAGPYRAVPAAAATEEAQAKEESAEEAEYRRLMRKWWF